MESTRDARRRKILNRGNDRLAFISGQTQSITDQDYPQNPVVSHSRSVGNISELSNQYPIKKYDSSTAGERTEIHQNDGVPKNQGSEEILVNKKGNEKALRSEGDSVPSITSMPRRSSNQVGGTSTMPAQQLKNLPLLSSKQVKHAVSLSGNRRFLFVITIALLVCMSNRGYALGGEVGRRLIYSGPLFIIMLTDLTIILWFLMTTRKGEDKETGAVSTGNEDYGWAVITLESLLMFQKVSSAIFMDCSTFAVIVICGIVL